MLMRWDPFNELDRLTEGVLGGRRPSIPMDALRREGELVVHFDLPGVDPQSIELTVQDKVLTVTAERGFEPRADDEVLVAERPAGTFARRLFLGDQLDLDNLNASYDAGVLTVTIPVVEAAKPRKIEISSGHGAQAIERGAHAA